MIASFPPNARPTGHARLTARTGAALLAVLAVWAPQAGAQTDPLARAAAQKGAIVTDSGLVYRVLKDGSGPAPAATDVVRVHYRGTFPDGKEFDSSYSRGQPASFPLNRVIKCWTEGLQRMKVGGKSQLTCPAALAYGDKGAGRAVPPGAILLFDVELLGIEGK